MLWYYWLKLVSTSCCQHSDVFVLQEDLMRVWLLDFGLFMWEFSSLFVYLYCLFWGYFTSEQTPRHILYQSHYSQDSRLPGDSRGHTTTLCHLHCHVWKTSSPHVSIEVHDSDVLLLLLLQQYNPGCSARCFSTHTATVLTSHFAGSARAARLTQAMIS